MDKYRQHARDDEIAMRNAEERNTPVIPDEAVDAAAKWLHDIDCRSAVHSGHPADIECYGWTDEARELVSLVAPHLLAAAWNEGWVEAYGTDDPSSVLSNPYRKATHGDD